MIDFYIRTNDTELKFSTCVAVSVERRTSDPDFQLFAPPPTTRHMVMYNTVDLIAQISLIYFHGYCMSIKIASQHFIYSFTTGGRRQDSLIPFNSSIIFNVDNVNNYVELVIPRQIVLAQSVPVEGFPQLADNPCYRPCYLASVDVQGLTSGMYLGAWHPQSRFQFILLLRMA